MPETVKRQLIRFLLIVVAVACGMGVVSLALLWKAAGSFAVLVVIIQVQSLLVVLAFGLLSIAGDKEWDRWEPRRPPF